MNEARRARIESFYAAFARLDAAAMQACYAADAQFDDEVFSLRGADRIGAMWRMLCDAARADGLAHWRLEAGAVTDRGAHWEARYRFGAARRPVHNRIDAEFDFDDADLIVRHRDRFDFPRWAGQALGMPGLLLGRTRWLRARVRAQAARRLQRFGQRQSDGRPSAADGAPR